MFARSVTVRLKPNSVAEFNRTLEKETPQVQTYDVGTSTIHKVTARAV